MDNQILTFLTSIRDFIWGPPLIILLVGTGIFLTLRLRGLQIRGLLYSLKLAFFHRKEDDKEAGDISHFQALMTALAATVGTGNIAGLLDACPGLKVILAHAGLPYFQGVWPLLDKYPNLYMDISGPYLNAGLVADVVDAVGSQRLLFGTDAPYGLRCGDGYSYAPMKAWTEQLKIPDMEKRAIFSGNLLRLLGG